MNAVARGITAAGVPLQVFDVAHTHVSYILPSLYSRKGVVVGAPTYEGHLFPVMASVLAMAEAKHHDGKEGRVFRKFRLERRRTGSFPEIGRTFAMGNSRAMGVSRQPDRGGFAQRRSLRGEVARAIKNPERKEKSMDKWECTACGYVYDPQKGDPEHGIPPGTPFENLPADWVCPECGAEKSLFEKIK